MDAEPKVVERMVERSQRPGDVTVSGFGLGGVRVAMPGCFVWGAEIGDFSGRMNSWKSVSEKLSYLTFIYANP